MTEAEWLACEDAEAMLVSIEGNASDRKLRLFACACCRRVWNFMHEQAGRLAVEAGEGCADGTLTVREAFGVGQSLDIFDNSLVERLSREHGIYWEAATLASHAATLTAGSLDAGQAATVAMTAVAAVGCQAVGSRFQGDQEAHEAAARPHEAPERAAQATLLRDIIGNPFRHTTFAPTCRAAVLSLAQSAYDDRHLPSGHLDPARLNIFADALEEAGCTDADILSHLRSPGPHVRGCWPLDLVLGRE